MTIEIRRGDKIPQHPVRHKELAMLSITAPYHPIVDVKSIIDSASPDHLKTLSVYCQQVVGVLQDIIQKFSGLKELCVIDKGTPQEMMHRQTNKSKTKLEIMKICSSESSVHQLDSILETVSKKHLKSLTLDCKYVTENLHAITTKFPRLEELILTESGEFNSTFNKDSSLFQCENVNNLSITTYCYAPIFSLNVQGLFDLKIKKLTKVQLSEAALRTTKTQTECNITELDLSDNDLSESGDLLGSLIYRMTSLQVLNLNNCKINKEMVKNLRRKMTGKQYPITELNMNNDAKENKKLCNDLSGCGQELGEILSINPSLYSMSMIDSKLTSPDLAAISDAVPMKNKIKKLNLHLNNLGDASGGGYNLLHKLPYLEAVKLGGWDPHNEVYYDDPVQALCAAIEEGALSNLHVLDLSSSELPDGSVKLLGQQLSKLSQLQTIDLMRIKGVDPEEYNSVYSNITPSVQHLNVNTIHVNLSADVILKNKESLGHLQKLNVKLDEPDIELLQNVLEKVSPDMQVYSDDTESIWSNLLTIS